ncbi:uncharacterized protein DEA37_0004357, partial [Paragonimus westermani]
DNFSTHANAKSNSLFVVFKTKFEPRRKCIKVSTNNFLVHFQLDTAPDITLITRSTWEPSRKPDVWSMNHQTQSASGNMLQLTDEVTCNISFEDVHFIGTCYLTDLPHSNLLRLGWIVTLYFEGLYSICV